MKFSPPSHPHSTLVNLRLLWQELRFPLSLLLVTFIGGTLGYKLLFPQEPLYRLFYMTAITLSTAGFGDVLGTDRSPLASAYTIVLLLVGMGTSVYAFSTLTAFFVEGALGEMLQQSKFQRMISRMQDHYIICGGGTTGVHVIREMYRCKAPFVVLDTSEERLAELREEFPDLLGIADDASHEDVLEQAGIHRASGLVAALTNDKDNLFLTLTARQMNPELKIVSKAVDMNIRRRLKIAGANYIVSPNYIGGMRMASEILRPNVVSFLDRMLRGQESDIRIHEVTIPRQSSIAGRNLGQLEIYRRVGVKVLALLPPGSESLHIYNPGDDQRVEADSVLFFIGSTAQRVKLLEVVE